MRHRQASFRTLLAALVEWVRDGAIVIDRQWSILVGQSRGQRHAGAQPRRALIGEKLVATMRRSSTRKPAVPADHPPDRSPRAFFRRRARHSRVPRQWSAYRSGSGAGWRRHPACATSARRWKASRLAIGGTRWQTVIDAVEIGGQIGHARLSVRETDRRSERYADRDASVSTCAAIRRRALFARLLAVGQRAAFSEALETVFRSGQPVRIPSQIVTREGVALDVDTIDCRGPRPLCQRRRGRPRYARASPLELHPDRRASPSPCAIERRAGQGAWKLAKLPRNA